MNGGKGYDEVGRRRKTKKARTEARYVERRKGERRGVEERDSARPVRAERRGVRADGRRAADDMARVTDVGPGTVRERGDTGRSARTGGRQSTSRPPLPAAANTASIPSPPAAGHTHPPHAHTARTSGGAAVGTWPHHTARSPGEPTGLGLEAKPRKGVVGTAGSRGTRINKTRQDSKINNDDRKHSHRRDSDVKE